MEICTFVLTLMKKVLVVFTVVLALCYGKIGFGPGEQDWDYVSVRPGANIFWWLYETTANVEDKTERPLVIWLQGGPGGSSAGFGNFAEIGPLDADLNKRNHTWVKEVNVLFIDNPVGSGYSYVEHNFLLTTNNKEIADDLVACLRGFYTKRPEFQNVPLFISSESYGGKMAVEFALELNKKIKSGGIRSNLLGVSLIDSWISPIQSILNWAPFLYNIGAVDQEGFNKIDESAQRTKADLKAGKFRAAYRGWIRTTDVLKKQTHDIDSYNILKKVHSPSWQGIEISQNDKIRALMNGPVKEALNLNATWELHNLVVFETLSRDFMKNATQTIEKLLNETTIKVQVVTGQLDLIVDTPGTVQWVDQLQWRNTDKWKKVPRNVLSVNGINEGYKKDLENLSLFWVDRAGHMVPADNPEAMGAILQDLIK